MKQMSNGITTKVLLGMLIVLSTIQGTLSQKKASRDIIICSNIFDSTDGGTFSVCHNGTGEGTSGTTKLPNGTEISTGERAFTYNIWKPSDVFNLTAQEMIEPGPGTAIVIQMSQVNNICKGITIGGYPCSSCEYCGDEKDEGTYTADCTNLPYGRVITCETNWPVYFPLSAESVAEETPNYNDLLADGTWFLDSTEIPTSSPPPVLPPITPPVASPVEPPSLPPVVPPVEPPALPPVEVEPPEQPPLLPPTSEPITISSDQPSSKPSVDYTDAGEKITCNDFTYTESGTSHTFPVCYTTNLAAISGIGLFENGTETPASQTYWYNYSIYDSDGSDIAAAPLFLITVERSGEVLDGGAGTDLTVCNYVAIDGDECSSCTYCGNETFSADCTNIPNGRKTKCESSAPLFFPFTYKAVRTIDTAPTPVEQSDAPSSVPVAAPTGDKIICTGFNYPKSTEDPFNICFVPSIAGISAIGAVSANETEEPPAEQIYWYNYTVYDKSRQPLFLIEVERSGKVLNGGSGTDLTVCDYVKVDGKSCTSCSYCGNETFSADCTNFQYGRIASCERTTPIFFPFTSEALSDGSFDQAGEASPTSSPIQIVVPPTSAPVSNPTLAPIVITSAPIVPLTNAPIVPPVVVPVAPPVSKPIAAPFSVTTPTTITVEVRPCRTFTTDVFLTADSTTSTEYKLCVNPATSGSTSRYQYDNGTVTPVQLQNFYNYTVYYANNKKLDTPIQILMERSGEIDGPDDRTQCDYLKVNGIDCSSCTFCGYETYSFDCTNVPSGRRTTKCETNLPFLFPLTTNAFPST